MQGVKRPSLINELQRKPLKIAQAPVLLKLYSPAAGPFRTITQDFKDRSDVGLPREPIPGLALGTVHDPRAPRERQDDSGERP